MLRFARKNEGKNLINKKLRPDLDRDFVWKIQKEAGFENISPEIIMNEVFDDQKLAKISRTFFRIKMGVLKILKFKYFINFNRI